VAAELTIPGRLELLAGEPPVLLDAAHNPDGMEALADAVPEIAGGRPVVACLAVLGDKDAAAMVAALAPALDRVVCAELPADALRAQGRPGAVSHPAEALARACEGAGLDAEAEPRFPLALKRARQLALERADGILLVSGSHYVLAPARAALGRLTLCDDGEVGRNEL
jgi:dihydrofolate synthase/folylpolyglutamate synthase